MRVNTAVFFIVLLFIICTSTKQATAANKVYTGMFGVYAWESRDDALKLIKSNGFDIAIANTEDIPTLNKIGLKGIIAFSLTKDIYNDKIKWNKFINNLKKQVEMHKDNPSVFAWYLVDEPELQEIPLDAIATMRNIVLAIDKTHPLFTVMNDPTKWKKYLPYFDIVAEDKYLDRPSDTLESVRDRILKLKTDIKNMNLKISVWSVIGALDLRRKDMRTKSRRPTPTEFIKMVDISLQEDVGGILIYTLSFKSSQLFYEWNLPKDDPLLWDTVKTTPKLVK